MKYHYSKDVAPSNLRTILHNYFSSLTHIHVPMKEHDNIIDETNQIESIEYYKAVSIETK